MPYSFLYTAAAAKRTTTTAANAKQGWLCHPIHNYERGGTMVRKHKKNKLKDVDNMDASRSDKIGSDNLIKPSDINKVFSILSKIDFKSNRENLILKENDYRIDILNSLKTFLPDEKCKIIDSIVILLSSSPGQNTEPDIKENTEDKGKVEFIIQEKSETADTNNNENA